MKIAQFNDFRLGVVSEGYVVDVSGVVEAWGIWSGDMSEIISRWDEFAAPLEEAATEGQKLDIHDVRFRQPVPKPLNIDCMALNYIEDGSGVPPAPINGFAKSPNSLIGDNDTMVFPDVPGTVFEGEAELGVIIGRRAFGVSAEDANDYIFGYTNLIDGSVRGLGPERNNFYQMKSRETFCSMGPWIVTADEVPDAHALSIRLWNNGVLMQDFNTRDMAYDIGRSIEFVSSLHTLEPGDVLATGTNHLGLHPFQHGDLIVLEVDGLGRLRMGVNDALNRTWNRETRGERMALGLEPISPQTGGKYVPDPPSTSGDRPTSA